MLSNYDKLIFEVSEVGRTGYRLPELDVECNIEEVIASEYLTKEELNFPEVSEFDVVRHYTNLSSKNYSLDQGIYPLGSCTMKYNPRINEDMAALNGFRNIHPMEDIEDVQGALRLMYELQKSLAEVAGMDHITLQPAAGAHGEYTGVSLIRAYHEKNGDTKRDKIIVPDSAHGTNPATAAMAGYKIVEIKSDKEGMVDLDALQAAVGDDTAGLMLTNPNTVGMSDKNIKDIVRIVHEAGGLCYYDGANLNAIMGHARPGDMGFDCVHYNLHKTMSTPHGGGGPGSGPVGCKEFLHEFLPVPVVSKKDDGTYFLDYDKKYTLGKVKDFYGHFAICVRAYTYILTMGRDGLKKASEVAVLNANYLQAILKEYYKLPLDRICKHEFVLAGLKGVMSEVNTLDIAKRILDKGFHAPTVYFPLIINEAIMIEPTETESKASLDAFANALIEIAKEAEEDPSILNEAPHNTPVSRPDETKAAKDTILVYVEPEK
ncbi:aminomethyl-transferring glycine dehydrogenase subunit GcvPB [Citroniella saccharovorans]|uniref:Probable glycine dehydrogenase (decarboxylating) subunit 2 n=1 Tax=Citroniella saccharovorans TaxID=2053367 RepID=A0AAW9MSF8_9FIRM|nr:aminomethyl-transferring glycine dehydrogenase subunit GcvPB [Citroniella saccharovorans]MEB3430056.1 aminomethyl-transferring glycine dehydrogenase subunit GcvPB [Citroniella saccharovorans]